MRARLKELREQLRPATHKGLWLDRYLESVDKEGKEKDEKERGAKRKLVREVTEEIPEPEEYAGFFHRYQEALKEVGARTCKAETRGRLVVGLGGEGVLETGFTLHRTYGVPYIPASALKGLASRYAHLRLEGEGWRRKPDRVRKGEAAALFGTQEEEGWVVFFDALPFPGKWKLWPDILNPHHPEYYRGEDAPPADWDSPVPVPFLSVTGTFLLALAPAPGLPPRPRASWRPPGRSWLGPWRRRGLGGRPAPATDG